MSHVKDNLAGRVIGFHQTYRWEGQRRTVWGKVTSVVPTILGEAIMATNIHTGEEELVFRHNIHTVMPAAYRPSPLAQQVPA